MALDETYQHKEWLGLLQPVGLVVSPPALVKAQAGIDRSAAVELQQRLAPLVDWGTIEDFPRFCEEILEWMPDDLVPEPGLEVVLPDYGETLRPTYGVPDGDRYLMLIQCLDHPFDEITPEAEKGWKVTPQAKFERLLRETGIPTGLLFNGEALRLVYAPRGESSGHITFPVAAMTEVAGRPILSALHMLLGADRLFNVPVDRRLNAILSDSRQYQAEVSTKLAGQVLDALWELLRGFQAADDIDGGALLRQLSKEDPAHIYGGLIAVLMRLVFLLYAEDEGLMPHDDVYGQNYSVSGLYERLREDAVNYQDTMHQRYGAWAWVLSLFRLVYGGGGHLPQYLPARRGQLFNPDEYPFLEGRTRGSSFQPGEPLETPRIADGVVFRVLDKLLMLEGERLSYRALDVEQIGSVYEALMGFEIRRAAGQSIALRPKDIVVNIDEILELKPGDRGKALEAAAECKLSPKEITAVKEAGSALELVTGIERKLSPRTQELLTAGSLFLQPGEERRRTGSHYTPRALTGPIVETTLRPVLANLGDYPTSEQLLELKVCDLAMGSGAFLVEACRQLAEKVVEAWTREGRELADDVEPLLAARRLVVQRCLYGVDRNPFAVNLAKLSLWLVTLAKDRPFTFVDHALKCGDSLVGVTRAEIEGFGQIYTRDMPLYGLLKSSLERARVYRRDIQEGDVKTDREAVDKVRQLEKVDRELDEARLIGSAITASFFDAESKKEREERRKEYAAIVARWREGAVDGTGLAAISERLRNSLSPFNWEIEFPEVFDRPNAGFDAIVGNPPFVGGKKMKSNLGEDYQEWLSSRYVESSKNADLAAYFFRRGFSLLRKRGTLGLIATNTIAQGDTRASGLRFICNNGGIIYNATRRYRWPGLASVVVSVVHTFVNETQSKASDFPANIPILLDGRLVEKITAFLFPKGSNDDPKHLLSNAGKSFIGCDIKGIGFTFDDTNKDATPIAQMQRLIEKDERNKKCVFPYIGGEEVNSSPTHAYYRYIINFHEMREDQAREWPDLMAIVEEKVKPDRLYNLKGVANYPWWRFWRTRKELYRAIAKCTRVLVIARVTKQAAFTFLDNKYVFNEKLVIFPFDSYCFFAIMQSRIKEIFTWFFSSTLGDGLNYAPSDCFETFPFPENWEKDPELEKIGKTYYEYRAELMIKNNQGLTDTYNRFHDPGESDPEIMKLRELHNEMDRAVLRAYGWSDIDTTCGFALDYLDSNDDNLPPEVAERIAAGELFFPTVEEACNFDSLARTGKRKLPWRYKWPGATHDEVLARLLDLNAKRYEEEILGGKQAEKKQKPKAAKKTAPKKTPGLPLFEDGIEPE